MDSEASDQVNGFFRALSEALDASAGMTSEMAEVVDTLLAQPSNRPLPSAIVDRARRCTAQARRVAAEVRTAAEAARALIERLTS